VVLALHGVLLLALLPRHEPWVDEAQAWLIARDISLTEMFTSFLRYEGTPGLWFMLLMAPAKLSFPYVTLNVLSAVLTIAGVFLVLRYSPLPPAAKALYPFTYFVFYQYGVVARSYVLLPVLLSLIAIVYPQRRTRIYAFTILLVVLGSVNLHGFLIALGLAAVEGLSVVTQSIALTRAHTLRYLKAGAIFGLLCLFNVVVLWPAGENSLVGGYNFGVANFLLMARHTLSDALTGNKYLSVLVFAPILWWLWQRGCLLLLAATMLPLITLFAVRWVQPHHIGILFIVLFFVLWVSYGEGAQAGPIGRPGRLLVEAAIVVLFAVQAYWTVGAYRYDYAHNFSGSKDVAAYLKRNNLDTSTISIVGNWSTSILPYFDRNIFTNYNGGQKPAYWVWRRDYNPHIWSYLDREGSYSIDEKLEAIVSDRPELIIISLQGTPYDESLLAGYALEGRFGGQLYWRDALSSDDSYAVYRRTSASERPPVESASGSALP
jgi:hypothetical protein